MLPRGVQGRLLRTRVCTQSKADGLHTLWRGARSSDAVVEDFASPEGEKDRQGGEPHARWTKLAAQRRRNGRSTSASLKAGRPAVCTFIPSPSPLYPDSNDTHTYLLVIHVPCSLLNKANALGEKKRGQPKVEGGVCQRLLRVDATDFCCATIKKKKKSGARAWFFPVCQQTSSLSLVPSLSSLFFSLFSLLSCPSYISSALTSERLGCGSPPLHRRTAKGVFPYPTFRYPSPPSTNAPPSFLLPHHGQRHPLPLPLVLGSVAEAEAAAAPADVAAPQAVLSRAASSPAAPVDELVHVDLDLDVVHPLACCLA